MIGIQIRIVGLIGIHLGLSELLDSKQECQNKWHPSKIVRLIGIYLGLPELLAFKQECQNDRHIQVTIVRLIGIHFGLP
jgi:hypothetical protein